MEVDEVRQYRKEDRQILGEWDQNILKGERKEKGEVRKETKGTWKRILQRDMKEGGQQSKQDKENVLSCGQKRERLTEKAAEI